MSSNVFNLSAGLKGNDFTPFEKTCLGDIAMAFRDQGLNVRMFLKPKSDVPIVTFINVNTGDFYLYVIRKQDQGAARYEISPHVSCSESYLNFDDVLKRCRSYINTLHKTQPAKVISLRQG